ncbi:MAG: XdhC family protein [Bdellovibrionota bacterium]
MEVELVRHYYKNEERNFSSVLATIVKKEGSSYRGLGAKILLSSSGESSGLLSGGCLEQEIVRRGLSVLNTGKPSLHTFDSRTNEDVVFGYASGCKGKISIFLEELPRSASPEQLQLYFSTKSLARKQTIAVIIECSDPEKIGYRFKSVDQFPAPLTDDEALLLCRFFKDCSVRSKSQSQRFVFGQKSYDVFCDVHHPPVEVHVIGAGIDAIPVYAFSHQLGWPVQIYDHRPAYLTRVNFPYADNLHLIRPENFSEVFKPKSFSNSYVIVMTHNYLIDKEYLRALLPLDLAFVGMLGPKLRGDEILSSLMAEGLALKETDLHKFYNPIGLELGGDQCETIALSMIAQIQQLSVQSSGKPLAAMRDISEHVDLYDKASSKEKRKQLEAF